MTPRMAVFGLIALLNLVHLPVVYAQGNGKGSGQSQGEGRDKSNGQGNKPDDDKGNANKGKASEGASNKAEEKQNNKPAESENTPQDNTGAQSSQPLPPAATEIDQSSGGLPENEAIEAVEAGRAVSLEAILPDLRERTGGEIIDAQLQQVGDALIYVATVLTPGGKVIIERYDARTGLHLEN